MVGEDDDPDQVADDPGADQSAPLRLHAGASAPDRERQNHAEQDQEEAGVARIDLTGGG